MPKLIVLAGVPGCGKSTWAKRFFPESEYAYHSTDDIRIEFFGSLRACHFPPENKRKNNGRVFDAFHKRIDRTLRWGWDTVADNTSLSSTSRLGLITLAQEAGCESHLIIFNNVHQARQRNMLRPEDSQVPEDIAEKMLGHYYRDTRYKVTTEPWNSITMIESFL